MQANKPAIIAISGVKNSGKTTLIEGLLPHLTAQGLQVAVVKHDGHSFSPDNPTTDTGRHLSAGAYGTVIFDGEKCQIVKQGTFDESHFFHLFPEADLFLLEGLKHSHWPKLEVVRKGNSETTVCDPATLLGVVTDVAFPSSEVPQFPLDDLAGVANYLISYIRREDDPC